MPNFLAHLLLAGPDAEAQVGQVLADLVPVSSIASFSPGIQAGIRAHQRIDVFTDTHPAVDTARRRMEPPYRRFAGVLLDVFFDHFLAAGWDRHGDGSTLADFAEERYRVLRAYRRLPVARYRLVTAAMQRDNWLVGYAQLSGVERALRGIARRCKYENPLATGASVLVDHYAPLRADFESLFPDLRKFARALAAPPGDAHSIPQA